jgi:uncharacterized protein YcbX
MTAHLHRITIYPIKSLDGVSVEEVVVLPGGALAGDRRFALVDAEGRFVNGKRTAAVHRIRAEFDLATMRVRLRAAPEARGEYFSLTSDAVELGRWFSGELGVECSLIENAASGFPDDTAAPGPTVVSTATLEEVAAWFSLTLDEVRRRFRANLEIDGVEPFWEDRMVGPPGTLVPIEIGSLGWQGVTACQRCAVPTRASDSGEPIPMFQKSFAERREASLPAWANPAWRSTRGRRRFRQPANCKWAIPCGSPDGCRDPQPSGLVRKTAIVGILAQAAIKQTLSTGCRESPIT